MDTGNTNGQIFTRGEGSRRLLQLWTRVAGFLWWQADAAERLVGDPKQAFGDVCNAAVIPSSLKIIQKIRFCWPASVLATSKQFKYCRVKGVISNDVADKAPKYLDHIAQTEGHANDLQQARDGRDGLPLGCR